MVAFADGRESPTFPKRIQTCESSFSLARWIEDRSTFENGTSDRDRPVGDRAVGAGVAMTLARGAAYLARLRASCRTATPRVWSTHTTVPNRAPTPAVVPMASAPQNVTRIAPCATAAPPARAAKAPKSARNRSEAPETKIIRVVSGANAPTNRGIAAPTAKLPADENAAWIGRARRLSEMPSCPSHSN